MVKKGNDHKEPTKSWHELVAECFVQFFSSPISSLGMQVRSCGLFASSLEGKFARDLGISAPGHFCALQRVCCALKSVYKAAHCGDAPPAPRVTLLTDLEPVKG